MVRGTRQGLEALYRVVWIPTYPQYTLSQIPLLSICPRPVSPLPCSCVPGGRRWRTIEAAPHTVDLALSPALPDLLSYGGGIFPEVRDLDCKAKQTAASLKDYPPCLFTLQPLYSLIPSLPSPWAVVNIWDPNCGPKAYIALLPGYRMPYLGGTAHSLRLRSQMPYVSHSDLHAPEIAFTD